MGIIWDDSLSQYRILGSASPATFKEKFKEVPQSDPPLLRSSCAVFVDILRATTTLVAVGAAGCRGIVVDIKPKDGTYSLTPPALPAERWVYGGEYNGDPIQGVDPVGNPIKGAIDNSPRSVRADAFQGKYLRFFSTNGADAFNVLSASSFGTISAMSFANIEATAADILQRKPDRVWIVCGGFYGGASLEDSVATGFLIKRLLDLGYATSSPVDDEAETMLIHARYFQQGRTFLDQELLTRLLDGQVFKVLNKRGHGQDIEACINGRGLETLWTAMKSVALVCTDMKQRLLVTVPREI